MKAAYICETSFHLFQCVRHVCACRNEGDTVDVYINENTDNRLKKRYVPEAAGLFDLVVRFDQEAVEVGHAGSVLSGLTCRYGKKDCYNTLKKKIAYSHFVRRALSMTGGTVSADRLVSYDKILAPAGTGFAWALSVINPRAEIVYYEDGIGGYYGDMFVMDHHADRLTEKLKGCGIDPERFRPVEYLVSYPEFSRSRTAPKISKLECGSPESPEIKKALHKVFGDSCSRIYAENKIVYFSPLTVGDHPDYKIVAERNIKLCRNIDSLGEGFVIRPHPKEKNEIPNMKNGLTDTEAGQWEMIAMEQISDGHILIGGCSTAQLTPKLLFDREPWVIFTYDELFGGTGVEKKEIQGVMNILLELYRDKDRVRILKNGESVPDVLRQISAYQ